MYGVKKEYLSAGNQIYGNFPCLIFNRDFKKKETSWKLFRGFFSDFSVNSSSKYSLHNCPHFTKHFKSTKNVELLFKNSP